MSRLYQFIKNYSIVVFIITLFITSTADSQNLKENLEKLSTDAAKGYLSPITSGMSSNLNSGWIHRVVEANSPLMPFSLDLEIGVVSMFYIPTDENKTFSSTGKFMFTDDLTVNALTSGVTLPPGVSMNDLRNAIKNTEIAVSISGPTVAGSSNDPLIVKFEGGLTSVVNPNTSEVYNVDLASASKHVLPLAGLDLPVFPLIAPQISIGSILGTKFAFRYLPEVQISKKLGKFSFYGFGFQHNFGTWFSNPLPLDLALGYFNQKMEVGDILTQNTTQIGLWAGKTLGMFITVSPYAGVTMEWSKLNAKYEYQLEHPYNPGQFISLPINFEVEGENLFKFIIGASIKLATVDLYIDYNMAKNSVFTGGIGVAF